MTKFATCDFAASGCNYPEGECLGLCVWKSHDGGPSPVLPETLVEFKMRGGLTVLRGTVASSLRWEHTGGASDVIAYREK